jgi:hypothetical protein
VHVDPSVSGNLDLAFEWLRKKGMATASKKSGRTASEGLIAVALCELHYILHSNLSFLFPHFYKFHQALFNAMLLLLK